MHTCTEQKEHGKFTEGNTALTQWFEKLSPEIDASETVEKRMTTDNRRLH